MNTIAQDPGLEYELQELYMLSRHWTSDINFVEDEIRILKDVLRKYLIHTHDLQLTEARNFDRILIQQDGVATALKTKVLDFLKFVEPYVNETKKEIGLDVLEKFIALESEIKATSAYIKLLRKLLFAFAEDVMREERSHVL